MENMENDYKGLNNVDKYSNSQMEVNFDLLKGQINQLAYFVLIVILIFFRHNYLMLHIISKQS